MTDAPPPIPNPPVRPGALPDPRRWLDLDFKALEERAIAICGIDPASLAGDRTAVLAALYGCNQQIVIIDEAHYPNPIGGMDDIEAETRRLAERIKNAKPEAMAEFKADNRKQRRIDEAKERRKPRGQRKRMVMDIESYDPNRAQDWKRTGPRGTRTDIAWR